MTTLKLDRVFNLQVLEPEGTHNDSNLAEMPCVLAQATYLDNPSGHRVGILFVVSRNLRMVTEIPDRQRTPGQDQVMFDFGVSLILGFRHMMEKRFHMETLEMIAMAANGIQASQRKHDNDRGNTDGPIGL